MVVHRISTTVLGVILVVGFLAFSYAATSKFLFPPNTGCVCPGSVLTYTCTAVGTGNTLWTGTAFDCATNGIILRHERFAQSGGAVGECNAGAIDGRSIGVENNCYTSEIAVAVSATFNNKTIQCIHNSGSGIITIGTSVITIFEAPYPQPNNIRLVDVNQAMLTFGWESLGPNCESVVYDISSTCGSCGPATTNATTVDCFGFQLSSNESTCTFSVNFMLCGNTGPSSTVMVTLKVPDIPRVTIIPIYSDANKTLLSIGLALYQEDSFDIVDGISGAILSYTIYFDSVSSHINSACGTDVCEYAVNLPLSVCDSSAIINVTVSATNKLGEGLSSDPFVTECTNQFIKVQYDPSTSTISCVFLNELDASEKLCSIRYGLCGQEQAEMAAYNTTTNSVMLNLDLISTDTSRMYCYSITARNRTYTVIVDGRIDIVGGSSSIIAIVVSVVVVIIIVSLVISGIAVLTILIIIRRRQKRCKLNEEFEAELLNIRNRFTDDHLSCLKLKAVDGNEWIIFKYEVDTDYSLKQLIEKQEQIFKRGHAFYEFTNEAESITEDQQLIFWEIESGKFFNLEADPKELREKGLFGEMVLRPSLSKYKVFVQSTSLGARHLAGGSTLLYMKQRPHPLWNVDPTQFKELQIEKDCTLRTFCEEHRLDPSKYSMYIECDDFQVEQNIGDVIVMDKDTKKYLTGPYAFHMVKESAKGSIIIKQKWRVFLWRAFDEKQWLNRDKTVLCMEQDQEHRSRKQQQQTLSSTMKPPLIRINSDRSQFVMKKLERDYSDYNEFRSLPSVSVDLNERNVFVEAGWTKMDGLSTADVILFDKDTGEFYTGPSAFEETKNYRSSRNSKDKDAAEKKFKALLLSDVDGKELLKNASVLHRVHKKQWQAEALVPILSKWLKEMTIEKKCEIGEFYHKEKLTRKEHKYIFVERTYFPQDEHIDDVILMEKDSKKLFTYPYSRRMVRKWLTGEDGKIRDEVQEQWRVFAVCKSEKEIVFEEDTPVLIQDPKYYTEKFHVLKVDKNNVRMSEFIRTKLGSFENGKAFYEFKEPEDLSYYKEVVHVPMTLIDRLTMEQKSESPDNTKFLQCSSFASVDYYYKIPGAPGYEVKPPPSSMNKVFVQSTSQGSRCLTTGMVILYRIQ